MTLICPQFHCFLTIHIIVPQHRPECALSEGAFSSKLILVAKWSLFSDYYHIYRLGGHGIVHVCRLRYHFFVFHIQNSDNLGEFGRAVEQSAPSSKISEGATHIVEQELQCELPQLFSVCLVATIFTTSNILKFQDACSFWFNTHMWIKQDPPSVVLIATVIRYRESDIVVSYMYCRFTQLTYILNLLNLISLILCIHM